MELSDWLSLRVRSKQWNYSIVLPLQYDVFNFLIKNNNNDETNTVLILTQSLAAFIIVHAVVEWDLMWTNVSLAERWNWLK